MQLVIGMLLDQRLVVNGISLYIPQVQLDCWAHLINQGVVVSGKSATVEWQGTGPSADNRVQKFQCSLDGGTKHFCKPTLLYYVFVQLHDLQPLFFLLECS